MNDSDYLVMLDGCEPFVLRFYCSERFSKMAVEYIKKHHKAFRKVNRTTPTKEVVDAALKLFNKVNDHTISWGINSFNDHIIKQESGDAID